MCVYVCVCCAVYVHYETVDNIYIRGQEPSEGVQEDDIEEEFEPKGENNSLLNQFLFIRIVSQFLIILT